MIIGVDIDGVLTDLYGYVYKASKEFFKNDSPQGEKIKNSNKLYEVLGMSKEQIKRFWDEYIWKYSKEVKFYKQASKYLKKLKDDGHQIYIITLRQYFGTGDENSQAMEKIIKDRFEENGIVYDKLFGLYGKNEKLSCILENKVDVMIDDEERNLATISQHVPCLCMKAKYNKNLKLENMTKCKNWKQVYCAINQLTEKTVTKKED